MEYVALLRWVNVGTARKVAMPRLKALFERLGFRGVSTYINSGNVLFSGVGRPAVLRGKIEATADVAYLFEEADEAATLAKLIGSELYKAMTLRNVNTARFLAGLVAGGAAAFILAASACNLYAQDTSTAAAAGRSALHAGPRYGHADSSVADILVSSYTAGHFVFNFAENKDALDGVFSALEDNYGRITGAFKIKPANRLKVEIYPDIKSYHRRTFGEGAADWMVGNFDPDERTLRFTSPNKPGPYHKYQDMLRTAVHEFTHSVVLEYRNWDRTGLPVWLDEGVAVYYSGQLKESEKRIKEGVAANKVPTITEMGENFMKSGGYAFSGTVVEFILKKYGEAKLREFVKEPSSYGQTFSMTENEFNGAWQKYVKKKYR
ncbi:MAG: DUF1697 domain-containing protein [Elusimicrobia bacterium]|nr:DUF1697 domain-containing protein [Elusimicrobiota bacterium]